MSVLSRLSVFGGLLAVSFFYPYLAIFGALLAGYVYYPPPALPKRLLDWRTGGYHFPYKGLHNYFRDAEGEEGAEEGVLVCLHGFPSAGYDWIKILPDLKKRFARIIMPDFLGFGFSDKPTDIHYSVIEQAERIEKLLEGIEVEEVHLLAHDYGDTVAQELLHRYAKRLESQEENSLHIKSLLMLNGGMFPEIHTPTPIQKILVTPIIGDIVTRLTSYRIFKKSFGRVFGPDTQPTEEEMKEFWMLNVYNEGYKISNKLLDYMAQRRANRDRWVGALQNSTVKIHTVIGPADPVNPGPVFIPFYRKTLPNAGLSILPENIGHYPQWEAPSAVIQHYFDFLDTL